MAKNGNQGGSDHAVRVFRVQRAFTELEGQVHGPGELAEATGLDDSTVHRILQSGIYDGIFAREGRGLYRLGSGAARLGLKALTHAPNTAEAHGVLEEMRKATDGGLVFLFGLAPFGGARKQCLDMAVGDSDLAELGISRRALLTVFQSLRTGACGRAILAHLPEVIQEGVLAEPLPADAGPGAFRDEEALLASLRAVREQGVAIDSEECAADWNGLAVPVGWDGLIMGSVAVLKPKEAMPQWTAGILGAMKGAAKAFTEAGGLGAWSSETASSF
ncbi:IclR family transcriptional regulator [Streptomyces sp. NPDC088400]|uniref:IclR family transcriptional regulator n=1 Tax=Streptomyces sp. NPDC088400 TaxID=3365861 RepID=UPI0037F68D64